jgi:hypothetical protein
MKRAVEIRRDATIDRPRNATHRGKNSGHRTRENPEICL